MKILVTGPTGFIGSAFRQEALAQGHEVAGLVRPDRTPSLLPTATGSMRWLSGTLAEPPWPQIESFAPEVCVHTAWITSPGVYLESSENELFFRWSLSFLRRASDLGIRHVIVLGTCIEYEIRGQPLSEEHTPIAPTTSYAKWKNALRTALENEYAGQPVSWAWARVFYPYGIGEHPGRLCTSVIQKLKRGEKVIIKTPHSTKDYIYITDLAKALLAILSREFNGPINLGTGQGVTVAEIATTIGRILGKQELIEISSSAHPDAFDHVVANSARLRALGWNPEVSLEAGLLRLIEHLRYDAR